MNAQTQKALAQFKAEAEALHSNRLLRAQEKFNQAELALSRDNSEGNQRAYNEAVYELNAIKAAV